MRAGLITALLLVTGSAAFAHRLDEYLLGTILSIGKGHVEVEMTLTPGVAVFPKLISKIDTDGDGTISEAEQRAYAAWVLRDLSLTVDGLRVKPRLASVEFPAMEEMKEGRGEIQLDVDADLPAGGRNRTLRLENRHQSAIAAYQVNCLVPRDPRIRIAAQKRNYTQSVYELNYEETDVRPDLRGLWPAGLGWASPIAGLAALLGLVAWAGWRAAVRGRSRTLPNAAG